MGADDPELGIIIEVQRSIDPRKRQVWPVYASTLHARMRCQTCLVVVAANAAVARWAAQPILGAQLGSAFVPLVLGPEQVPRITDSRQATRSPELAVLSALAHGEEPGALEVAAAALDAVASLDEERATLFYDLILGSLPEIMAQALEQMMVSRKYEYRSTFARRYFSGGEEQGREQGRGQGREQGLRDGLYAVLRTRLGEVPAALSTTIDASSDVAQLVHWLEAVSSAPDRASVLAIFGD